MSDKSAPGGAEPGRMREEKTRAIILTITVVVGIVVALIPLFAALRGGEDSAQSPAPAAGYASSSAGQLAGQGGQGGGVGGAASGSNPDNPSGTAQNSGPVQIAHPRACPQEASSPAPLAADAELRSLTLPCLTSGNGESSAPLAHQLAGKPAIVNLWAWWCGPCRAELPIVQQVAQRHPEWNVVGVHLDSKAQAGADFLEQLGVDALPSYQDSNHAFDSTTKAPKVVPLTYVYRPDGTRAKLYAQTFHSAEELEKAITQALG